MLYACGWGYTILWRGPPTKQLGRGKLNGRPATEGELCWGGLTQSECGPISAFRTFKW